MARMKRVYSIPLVVTVAAAMVPGCNTGNTTDGQGGEGAVVPPCDPSEVSNRPGDVDCTPGQRCTLPLTCTSGAARSLEYVCQEDGSDYALAPDQAGSACANPYEGCSAPAGITYDCRDERWAYYGGGGNPPAPCPGSMPEEGANCRFGDSFGADRAACGYPCADDGDWTVIGCVDSGEGGAGGDFTSRWGEGVWQGDDACSSGAGSGPGGAGSR